MIIIRGVYIDNKKNICIDCDNGDEISVPLSECSLFYGSLTLPQTKLVDVKCNELTPGLSWEVLIIAYSKDSKEIILDLIEIDQEFLKETLPF